MSNSAEAIALPKCAVVVMGVSGCGKSTLMAALAEKLSCTGLEGDAYHSEANVEKMRAGTPLTDADRWPWLDHLGAAMNASVERAGIAVASCSALRRTYRERLAKAAGVPIFFAFLDGERELIAEQMSARRGHYMPPSLLDSQFATLEPPLGDELALRLSCFASIDMLVDEVLAWLNAAEVSNRV